MRTRSTVLLAVAGAITQTGCVVVGYSSQTGWSVWPGLPGLLLMAGLILLWALFFKR